MTEKSRSKLQAAVLDAAGSFRGRARSPALGLYATDLQGLDVRAEIVKRRLRYLIKTVMRDVRVGHVVREVIGKIEENDIKFAKGPVALILKDLREMGADLRDDLLLVIPGEQDTDIIKEPIEIVMRRVNVLAQKKFLRDNARTRGILEGLEEIELCKGVGTYDALEEPDKKVMRLITAGGLWTGKHAQKAEGSEVARCRLCGEETPTMVDAHRHMFWRCCHHEVRAYRQDAWRFDEGFDPERLPDILACYGVAPAMWLDPDKTFWGTPTTAECWRPSWPAAAAADGVVRAYRVEHPDMNARQILEHMKGRTDAIDPTDAPVTWEEAPTDPNAFSDGSAVPPGTAIDTLAGAGSLVAWPHSAEPPADQHGGDVCGGGGGTRRLATLGSDRGHDTDPHEGGTVRGHPSPCCRERTPPRRRQLLRRQRYQEGFTREEEGQTIPLLSEAQRRPLEGHLGHGEK